MPEIAAIEAEIVIVADADVWCEGLPDAVAAVKAGATWAIPHRGVFRLTRESTEQLLAGREPWELELEQSAYLGTMGGGFVVARRETLLDVPLDPRFIGWGQEDESWGIALSCLAGRPWRGKVPLVHLWHPAPPRLTRRRGSVEGMNLRRRYGAAIGDPALMRALIEEAKDVARNAAQPTGDDRQALGVG
jgi:hypothetical protein